MDLHFRPAHPGFGPAPARYPSTLREVWEAKVDRDVVEKPLRLERDARLAVGDAVAVRIWDAITGELLAEQPATVYVELDW